MAKVRLISTVTNGIGPFTYKYETISGCGDITFTDPDGNTGLNSIEFTDVNEIITVDAEFSCNNEEEILGKFKLTVTGEDGVCVATTEVEKNNPCFNFQLSLEASSIFDGNFQNIVAHPGNGNAPFTYEIEEEGDIVIIEERGSLIKIIRENLAAGSIRVSATDNNGCQATATLTLPASGENPVLRNFSKQLDCESNPVIIDVIALATDVDGSIDLSTITIVTAPSLGTTIIDTVLGTITYTPNIGSIGTDTLAFTVEDNSGNLSNKGIATIIITPCSEVPVANPDLVTVSCNNSFIIPVQGNDTDADGVIVATQIITNPLHGTAVANGDGTITYTPNLNYNGLDNLRYAVVDNDENVSNIALVSITVEECCDAHDLGLEITCSENPLLFTATGTGTAPSISSDVIEFEDINNPSYLPGNVGQLGVDCTADESCFVDTAFTQPDGTFFTTNEIISELTITPLGNDSFRLEFDISSVNDPNFMQALFVFFRACFGGVIKFRSDFTGAPLFFSRDNITAFNINTQFISLDYNAILDSGVCASSKNNDIQALILFLQGITVETSFQNVTIDQLCCLNYGGGLTPLKFRRTVTRPSCPDVIIEKEVTVTDINNPCSTMVITVLQSGGGTGPSTEKDSCEAELDVENAFSITNVNVNGTNILSTPHLLDDNGLNDLEGEIQEHLDLNGGGTVTVLLSTNTLFVQIINKDAVLAPFLAITNNIGGSSNFNVI